MRSKIFVLISLLLLILPLEYYIFTGISGLLEQSAHSTFFWLIYVVAAILSVLSAFYFAKSGADEGIGVIRKPYNNVMAGLAVTMLLTKLSFAVVLFAGDLYRLAHLAFLEGTAFINGGEYSGGMLSRSENLAQFGLLAATLPFMTFIHGITIGKYKYTVKKVQLFFDDLPEAFDGYRILQFSDMHSGSFDSLERVKKGIEKMQAEEADLILFTGDMVNNKAEEVLPFIPVLSELKARDGKFSILGNHDYGDYIPWASREAKIENLYRLIRNQHEAGFEMLLNEHVFVRRGDERICIAGVENWGKPPFPQHGDLAGSLKGIDENDFVVLMSHDPSHWDLEVLKNQKKVHLTLSGHTHGMQMGFDIPGLKWSPVKYKYPRWSGLYEELGRYLYVNNGFGFLGFPGRVGIYPEITSFELKKKKSD